MNTTFKWIITFIVSALLVFSKISYAAVFSIIPKVGTSLPSIVTLGGSVTALYTVTNTTGSFHTSNYVKYLPPNTTQVTVDATYSDLCGATFDLPSRGSCTLELNVTGAVNAMDPNPRNHLFVCLGGCVTCCAGTNFPLNVIQDNPVYTAVFDAGSSGTRLSFYKVIPGHGNYPMIDKIGTYDDDLPDVPDDDGINNFLNNDGSIRLSPGEQIPPGCPGLTNLGQLDVEPCVLQPLLIKLDEAVAAQNIQNISHADLNSTLSKSQVKVELFATAGMRTEDTRNGGSKSTQQIAEYYSQMRSYVADWGYDVGEFKTINGNSEEGLWTWVNLNDYYYNIFGGNPAVSPIIQDPVGDFEVGGSSMQVAFPTHLAVGDTANVYSVAINGHAFNVYSKTFLGLGGDDARKYVKAFGYNSNTGGSDCYASTATTSNTEEKSGIQLYPSDQIYSGVYPFPTNIADLGVPWTIVSASSLQLTSPSYDTTQCSNMYNTIVNQVTSLPRNNYGTFNKGGTVTMSSFKSDLQNSTAPFIGTDNFFYTADDLGFSSATGFDPVAFQVALENYCNSTVANNFNAQSVCPNGHFMSTYLFGPSGLFNSSAAIFTGVLNPANLAGETVLTWTRGYLLMRYAN